MRTDQTRNADWGHDARIGDHPDVSDASRDRAVEDAETRDNPSVGRDDQLGGQPRPSGHDQGRDRKQIAGSARLGKSVSMTSARGSWQQPSPARNARRLGNQEHGQCFRTTPHSGPHPQDSLSSALLTRRHASPQACCYSSSVDASSSSGCSSVREPRPKELWEARAGATNCRRNVAGRASSSWEAAPHLRRGN